MTNGIQYFPQTLPANSVVGRISPSAGATEAIPLSALAAAIYATLNPTSTVRMAYINGAWVVNMPGGTIVNTSLSTTSGLQEAINASCTPLGTLGYDLEVFGYDAATGSSGVINCTTQVVWPPMQGKHIRFGAVTINFTGAVGAGAGMLFNSLEMVNFDATAGCQIVYAGSGDAVRFTPSSGTPLDGLVAVTDSVVNIGHVTCNVVGTSLVKLDQTSGPIINSRFYFTELNSNGYSTPGLVLGSGTHGIIFNDIECPHLHKSTGASLQVGTSTTNNVSYNNILAFISSATGAGPAIDCYGFGNAITTAIGVSEGTPATGILLESSATKNIFKVLQNTATTPVTDSSTNKDNEGIYGSWKPRAMVSLSASQTGIASGVWTKVQFNTKAYDTGLAFDNTTNFRWTPGRPGYARISASVCWVGVTNTDNLVTAIYKNGAELIEWRNIANGTGGSQGAALSADVQVTSATDYFEIWCNQNSGSAQAIQNGVGTWATFSMLDG